MKSLLCVLLVACGGAAATKPLGNTGSATPSPEPTSTPEPRKPNGGVIELGPDRGPAMEAAFKEMEAHCGAGNYTITQEGEEAAPGKATVWRVHYECAGAAPPSP